ncbi:hypothetical protein SK128_021593 [Halocaridina rubra]|uniref:Carboxylic ester hydrolase n=1 Tax=Halocaridina rubra TaxID=373956 RepID=A0AAN9A3F4_HALRR
MLFIHGGGFIIGDASLYLPTKLLDHDIILVVTHYRLGTLGFFSLLNDDAPGNAALWDQIEAMKWVQNNIEGFGGDKNRVTIFGQSAGSVSVTWHHILPESHGLFRAVIADSGSIFDHWALDPEPLVSGALVAGKNGCPNDTNVPEDIYECMISMTHENISLNLWEFESEDRGRGQMGFRGSSPIIDLSPNVSRPLITKTPEEYFIDGEVNDVPLLIGANKHEGSYVLAIMYLEHLVPNNLVNNTEFLKEDMIPAILNAFGVDDQTNGIGESLTDAYLGGEINDFESISPGLIDLAGVLFLKAGAWQTAKTHAKYLQSNVYFYSFDFESDDSMFKWMFIGAEVPFEPGATHMDEMMYLFCLPALMEGQQITVMNRMTTLWTNFVRHRDPTPDTDKPSWQDLNIPKWQPLTFLNHTYMLIQDECTPMLEYPERWHIAYEESKIEKTTTVPPESTTRGPSKADFDQLEQERQAFMISMIVFIVTTVLLAIGCAVFFFRSR